MFDGCPGRRILRPVADLSFRFHRGALHFPSLNLWLDAHEPIGPAETVFISHAHSDHTAPHARVLVSEPTGRLLRARLPGDRTEQVLPFGRTTPATEIGIGVPGLALTLFPAGHILGSAMIRLELAGQSLLYTGDFKLRPGRSAEPCQPAPADVLVMETTYGRPHYAFPPTDEVVQAILRFCREAFDNDEVPVLLGYSLGKSQEILQGLHGAGLPVMLHEQVLRLTRVYEACGQRFPEYRPFDPAGAAGHVVLAPPGQSIPALRRRLGRCRLAMLTGWALDPGARFRYQADAVFPLSDHADFPDLVELVRQVGPRRVHTLHGFAADFAAHLRQLGLEASALSEPEQLQLLLGPSPDVPAALGPGVNTLAEVPPSPIPPGPADASPDPAAPAPAEAFGRFAATCAAIAAVRPKREKVRLLAGYLASVPGELVGAVTLWFCGTPFASSANKPLQVGWSLLQSAISEAAGVTRDRFHQAYLRHGETGETVAALFREAPRPAHRPRLPVSAMAGLFEDLHRAAGPAARLSRLAGVLRQASPEEGRFLVKILTGDLRIGLKEGLVEEAVAEAFGLPADAVRAAHQLAGDLGEVARLAQAGRLHEAGLVPLRPVKVMLASPEPDADALLARARAWAGNAGGDPARPAVWLEDKYDGIRCQLHKVGGLVRLFSRDLKDITGSFPELAGAAGSLPHDMVLDGEILAMDGERVLGFAELQKRLGRRGDDLFLGTEVPVRLVAFDLLWIDGESLLERPLRRRRERLGALLANPGPQLALARVEEVGGAAAIDAGFRAARARGHEGLVIKDPGSPYSPGRRGLSWLKLKQALATLDCVVVAAEYGHGKRRGVLSDYTFAVRDDATGALRTIGKAYSGLTDAEIARLTDHFLARVIRQRGRIHEVIPDVVLEIAFDALQPSDRHTSGLAMRFPRIARIREDKTPADIDTVRTARKVAGLEE